MKELGKKWTKVYRLTHRVYIRRAHMDDPVHQEHRGERRAYAVMIVIAKRCYLEGFLESVNERIFWTTH